MSCNSIDQEKDFQVLILFVRDQIREYKKSITRETSIENDLGVTGEEAAELLSSFSAKFNVDISKFDFDKYFNEEPNVFVEHRNILTFTIGHLEKAMIAGFLNDDVINRDTGT